jgi:hypothetical protein
LENDGNAGFTNVESVAARTLYNDSNEAFIGDRLSSKTGETQMTEDEYWGELKKNGILGGRRLTEKNYLATSRDNEPLTVADPTEMTPEDRAEAAARTISLWG